MRAEEEDTQEDKIGHIWQEIVDGVPLGVTATAALMGPSPSSAD